MFQCPMLGWVELSRLRTASFNGRLEPMSISGPDAVFEAPGDISLSDGIETELPG